MSECLECGETGLLHEHHIRYNPPESVDLCPSCHRQVHSNEHHELYPEDKAEKVMVMVTREQRKKLKERRRWKSEPYFVVLEKIFEELDDE